MTDAPGERLAAVVPAATAPRGGTQLPADASPAFRILLDSLERLAQRRPEPRPAALDPEALRSAMREAESGFQQAMDLRRRLEDAFRSRLS